MYSSLKAQYAVLVALRAAFDSERTWRRETAKALKLTETDISGLFAVLTTEPCTPGDFQKQTGLTSGAATTAIDRLEKLGYLKRQVSKTDRRRIHLVPIAKKMTRVTNSLEKRAQQFLDITEQFGLEELAILRRFLGGIVHLNEK
ncbi:hypothetical protein COW46_01730 [Candidatus Gracilibacteria bacterium CG17_big_fil_post_rev_8_21_14_2_50_48_13]|nr:MAG: hypothetical protein COW46_01730 [Candidatus Gracilibacteria bacterium CG17_big_fil_post_rev_8_21_14_2_50_48_13]